MLQTTSNIRARYPISTASRIKVEVKEQGVDIDDTLCLCMTVSTFTLHT